MTNLEGDGVFKFLPFFFRGDAQNWYLEQKREAARRNLRLVFMHADVKAMEFKGNLGYLQEFWEPYVSDALREPLEDGIGMLKVLSRKKVLPAHIVQYILQRYL